MPLAWPYLGFPMAACRNLACAAFRFGLLAGALPSATKPLDVVELSSCSVNSAELSRSEGESTTGSLRLLASRSGCFLPCSIPRGFALPRTCFGLSFADASALPGVFPFTACQSAAPETLVAAATSDKAPACAAGSLSFA